MIIYGRFRVYRVALVTCVGSRYDGSSSMLYCLRVLALAGGALV